MNYESNFVYVWYLWHIGSQILTVQTWKQSRMALKLMEPFLCSKPFRKGSTLICSRLVNEAGVSFFLTHWMPMFGNVQVMSSLVISILEIVQYYWYLWKPLMACGTSWVVPFHRFQWTTQGHSSQPGTASMFAYLSLMHLPQKASNLLRPMQVQE